MTRDRFDPAGGGRRCLLFDLGNVLIDFDHGVVSRTLARHATGDRPAPAEAIHEYIFGDSGAASPNAGIDRGTGSLDALHAKVAARFSLAISLDEFRRAWLSIFADDLNRTVADRLTHLAHLASARFDVRICSNTNEPHWSGLRAKHLLLDALDQDQQCLLSFRIGKIKTDPGFFPHVATVTGLPVSDHLLIDDRRDNCEAAEAAGMRALQFRAGEPGGAARIDDALRRTGWLADG